MKTLSQIFNDAVFLIPDYQRGYAWGDSQLEDFWKDLTWLRAGQKHYTGMLTLYPIDRSILSGYPANFPLTIYHLVDGQQRLTTSYLLLHKLITLAVNGEIAGQPVASPTTRYLAATISGHKYPTFGYCSPEKMTFFQELLNNSTEPKQKRKTKKTTKNIYEKNLLNASEFLDKKISNLNNSQRDDIYTAITTQLVFDIHEVQNTFDACAMFESINYRGKKLTKFEVLKNRLMYLTELIQQADPTVKHSADILRENIELAWGNAFNWLGSGGDPLDEDDFLLNHTVMYFGALPKEKEALDSVLFKKEFSTDRLGTNQAPPLTLELLKSYVENIDKSSELWALQHSCIVKLSNNSKWITKDVVDWLLRLNRVGMRHFKPLILGALNRISSKNSDETAETLLSLLKQIERFVFVMYELCEYSANQKSKTEFRDYGNEIFKNIDGCSFNKIVDALRDCLYKFNDEDDFIGYFDSTQFIETVHARFLKSKGWTDWDAIKYFLSEWETHLIGSGNITISTDDYKNLSVEHIMPQNPEAPGQWQNNKLKLDKRFKYVVNDLGNLVLLGIGANKAVQDVDLKVKADAYKLSASCNDVLKRAGKRYQWNNAKITRRGKDLVEFLRERWELPGQEKRSVFRIESDQILSVTVSPPKKSKHKV